MKSEKQIHMERNVESAVKKIKIAYRNALTDMVNAKTDQERVLITKHLSNLLALGEALNCSMDLHEILKEKVDELKW